MDSTAESGGGQFAGTKHAEYWPKWRSYQEWRKQLTRRKAVAALLVRARTDRRGKRKKKEAKKKAPTDRRQPGQ